MFRRIFAASLVFALLGGSAAPFVTAAAHAPETVTTPPLTYKTYASVSFTPIRSEIGYSAYGATVHATSAWSSGMPFIVPISLPQGALIYQLEFYVIDNSPASKVSAMLGWYEPQTDAISTGYAISTTIEEASPNVRSLTYDFASAPFYIDNSSTFYFLEINLSEPNVQAIAGARVGYYVPSPVTGAQAVTLGGWAFRPDTSSMKYAPYGGQICVTQNVPSFTLGARLDLPVGARIDGVTFFVVDANLVYDLDVNLSIYSASNPSDAWGTWADTSSLTPSWEVQPLVLQNMGMTVKAGDSYNLLAQFDTAINSLCIAGVRVNFTPPPGPQPHTSTAFAGMNLLPITSSLGYSASGTTLFQLVPDPSMGFSFLLDLPQGAAISGASCYAIDNDGVVNHDVQCYIEAFRPASTTLVLFYANFSNNYPASTAVRELKIISPRINSPVLVDNQLNQYVLYVYFGESNGPGVKLVGAVVETGYQVFVPAVRR